jgi:protein TonB
MFDAVLGRSTVGPSRWGGGTLLAIALHVVALGAVIWASLHAGKKAETEAPVVTFFAPPPPPPPPPPAGGGPKAPKVEHKKITPPKKDVIVEPKKEEPKPEPTHEVETPEPAPSDTSGQQGGEPGGVPGGQVGGVVGGQIGGVPGGQVGGVVGGTGTTTVIPFGAGMARPTRIGGDDIRYTREAREAHVSGVMIVKCVITVEGTLTNCRVIKGVPLMEQTALAAIRTWRYTPVQFQGHAQSVDYTFTIHLKMPD